MRREDDDGALPELAQQVEEAHALRGVEPRRRLVDDDEPRVAQQRDRDAEPLAHAARVAAQLPPAHVPEVRLAQERVRFLNLLSEIGEDSAVILSTHIVEDVEELCNRLAIIDRGEILLEAEPARAIEELRGRIWRRTVSRDELPALERDLPVISTKLMAGRTIAHVYAVESPGAGFEPVEPDMKDVYFTVMAGHHGRRAAEAAS